jgi:hypothetical protein
VSGLIVIERARIERNCPAQKFSGENPLFLFGKILEGFQKLDRLGAHTFRLASFDSTGNPE